jgi:hypothetical protein
MLPPKPKPANNKIEKLAQAVKAGFDEAQKDRKDIRTEMKTGFDEARRDREKIRTEMKVGFDEVLTALRRVEKEVKILAGETITVRRLESEVETNRREIATLKQHLHLS